MLPDEEQRIKALDTRQSFIVQAPAGSGKTELLIQRFLSLLAYNVKSPQEILAITFTKKAANEMRLRITQALKKANMDPQKNITIELARRVLEKNKKLKWDILKNPNQLRIQTIDSLCLNLVNQMPILARFGINPNVTENPIKYYEKAARSLLSTLEHNNDWSQDLVKLLLYFDNNHENIAQLFTKMLSCREQWLSYLLQQNDHNDFRDLFEQALKEINCESLEKCYSNFPINLLDKFKSLASFAFNQLDIDRNKIDLELLNKQKVITKQIKTSIATWKNAAELLLTQDCKWRLRLDKNNGFPQTKDKSLQTLFKGMKKQMLDLISELKTSEKLRQSLQDLLESPPLVYDDDNWQISKTLMRLLPLLAAQLNLVFHDEGVVDFNEISSRAIQALGNINSPTELALKLDYQIYHLLIDEFQDTSLQQLRLLELLTAGWQENDGRTLFLVGDPMQSIYRFRQAEVGLFLRIWQEGLNGLNLIPLTLTSNFRSNEKIIDWLNGTFSKLFPKVADIALGAIEFTPCVAIKNTKDNTKAVNIHKLTDSDDTKEAELIIKILNEHYALTPEKSIAILVRSRSHLQTIIPWLKKSNISFLAIDIEKLQEATIIQDLFALTRALTHLADRIAWLAILRAPWCGLSLNDLYYIAQHAIKHTIWDSLCCYQDILHLSDEAKIKLPNFIAIIKEALSVRGRKNHAQWLKGVWLALDGPSYLIEQEALPNAELFFSLLGRLSKDAMILPDLEALQKNLEFLYAKTTATSTNPVQIMTIHKAKGLEFDTVIIPSLEKRPANNDSPLLRWLERPRLRGGSDFILAPLRGANETRNPIYDYLTQVENKKNNYEHIRLLYVAATRAKSNLHLIATINSQNDSFLAPIKGSFLELLGEHF